ncbi:putative two-component response-regulatory protein YehT [Sphingobacterium mizutaii]|uniref:Two-component response-regulatory protein YehT n=2 Tax=Sphingobacterium mizutaii TaxID=1010 RepID=A0AAJ5BYS4_9SPHI|nr:hypothetical protein SAMN05192578_10916 [Sphingobacterium mizutaii]SNV38214.1 putative two-component response-regulatory protein YehT [Sphingobacterium mizutaii]
MYNKSKSVTCMVIEDEVLSLEMMEDYIGRRKDLKLVGICHQLSEIKEIVEKHKPAIIFLDLKIPIGDATDFHYGMLPKTASIVVVSGIPLNYYKGELPTGDIFELSKPVSFECFDRCVDKVLKKRGME